MLRRLPMRVRPLVAYEIIAARERFVTRWARIPSRLVHLSMGGRMSLEIFGVPESFLACCAVVLVSSDGIVRDFMVSGLDVSNPLSQQFEQAN
jgi:hypothetical protein